MTGNIQLEKICLIITDGTHASPIRTESGVPVLSAQNVKGGTLDFATNRFTNQSELGLFQKRIHPKNGDVMLTIVGTVGRSAVLRSDMDFVLQRSVAILRPDNLQVDNEYLKRALDSTEFQAQLSSATNSSAQAGVYLGKLNRLAIPLPSLPEQRRIAAILNQADELRAKRRYDLDLLDELADSVFADIAGQVDGSSRPLGEHLSFLTSGSRGWAKYYSDTGTPFLRIQNVARDQFIARDLARVHAPEGAEERRTRVQVGDVVLSITADLGRTAVIPDGLAGAHVNQHLAILRAPNLNSRFLSAYLSSDRGKAALMKRNKAAVKDGLNFDDIRSVEIPEVSREAQRGLSNTLDSIDLSRQISLRAIYELDELFASLQHQAFSGEL